MSVRGTSLCRCCEQELGEIILSLGSQPLSNALPTLEFQALPELFPLDFRICLNCGLGQIGEYVSPAIIFEEYTYFSSASSTWLAHAKNFAQSTILKMNLSRNDLVLEIASNDGYLLQYFKESGVAVLGIEPAENVAKFAEAKGIPTRIEFFGRETAKKLVDEDNIPSLVIANNVLAHVPDINDFMAGLSLLASRGSIISIEAPTMHSMFQNNYFDTIYHEHFSYLSAHSVEFLAQKHGVTLFDLDLLETHGGSYRYWLKSRTSEVNTSVEIAKEFEVSAGIFDSEIHRSFAIASQSAIANFQSWVRQQPAQVVGFGAAAKATVLLNAAGISNEKFLAIADSSLSKQGRWVPGVNIQIVSPEKLFELSGHNLVIFPWNIAEEIHTQIRVNFPKFLGEIWVALPYMRKIS
jgi:hypothetical protein